MSADGTHNQPDIPLSNIDFSLSPFLNRQSSSGQSPPRHAPEGEKAFWRSHLLRTFEKATAGRTDDQIALMTSVAVTSLLKEASDAARDVTEEGSLPCLQMRNKLK